VRADFSAISADPSTRLNVVIKCFLRDCAFVPVLELRASAASRSVLWVNLPRAENNNGPRPGEMDKLESAIAEVEEEIEELRRRRTELEDTLRELATTGGCLRSKPGRGSITYATLWGLRALPTSLRRRVSARFQHASRLPGRL